MTSLSIRVVRAKDLRAADINGKSDPYVKVLWQRKEGKGVLLHTTPVIYKTLQPAWDAAGGKVPDDWTDGRDLQDDDVLTFEVWDKDKVTKDDFLGFVRVRVGETPPFLAELDYEVRGEHKETSGTLRIEFSRTSPHDKAKKSESDPWAEMTWKSEWEDRKDALLRACGMNVWDKVDEEEAEKLVLTRGPQGDDTLDLKRKDRAGRTPLHFAAKVGGSERLIRLLVEKAGLDPNERMTGTGGYAPVHLAAIDGRVDTLRALKAVGADLDLKTGGGDMYAGNTAAHCCYQFEKLESLKVLKELGAKINLPDSDGQKLRDKIEEDKHSKFTNNKAEWLAVFDA